MSQEIAAAFVSDIESDFTPLRSIPGIVTDAERAADTGWITGVELRLIRSAAQLRTIHLQALAKPAEQQKAKQKTLF